MNVLEEIEMEYKEYKEIHKKTYSCVMSLIQFLNANFNIYDDYYSTENEGYDIPPAILKISRNI